MDPIISIVIPLYNRKILVEETINSVLSQSYVNWELLIIDDGSTDNSVEFLQEKYRTEKKIRIIKRTRSPKGANTCRNIGFAESRGEYIIFFDSDDLMAPFCLERRVEHIKKFPESDFLVFNTLLFKKEVGDFNFLWNIDNEENDLCRFLRLDGVWPIFGPIHKKESLLKYQQEFDEDLPFWQDYDFHVNYLIKKPSYQKFLQLDPDCFCRRHSQQSISQKGFGKDLNRKLTVKKEILFGFRERILDESKSSKSYIENLAVNLIAIADDYFRNKRVLKSYKLLFYLWAKGMISFLDLSFLLVKQPLLILKIKYPGSQALSKWEKLFKPHLSQTIHFPEYTILKVKSVHKGFIRTSKTF